MRQLPLLALAACLHTGERNCTPGTCENWVDLAASLDRPPAALSHANVTLCLNGACTTSTLPAIDTDLVNLDGFLPHWDVQVSVTTTGGTQVSFGCPDCALSLANGDVYRVTLAVGTQVLLDRQVDASYSERASCTSDVVCKVAVLDL